MAREHPTSAETRSVRTCSGASVRVSRSRRIASPTRTFLHHFAFLFFSIFLLLGLFFCALSLISFPLFIFNFCVFFLRFLPPPPPPQFPVFYGTIRMEEGTKFQTSSMFFCSSAFIFMGVAPVGGGIVSIRSIASSSSGFRLAFIE